MFKCYQCEKLSEPREKAFSLIIGTREKKYRNWKDWKDSKEIITTGWEITKEVKICLDCNSRKEISDV